MTQATRPWPIGTRYLALGLIVLLALPFVAYAAGFGLRGLTADLSETSYLYTSGGLVPNLAIFGHMLAGAVITLLAPLQLVGAIRTRYPALHRTAGYIIFTCAMLSATGGLIYIALRGTIGGTPMDLAFAAYGLCVIVAAFEAVRHARAGRLDRHRRWALRLFVLAIGSWLYRVHYTLWHIATGGLWTRPDFGGAFDLVTMFAFFVPYLIGLEIWFRRRSDAHVAALAKPPAPSGR